MQKTNRTTLPRPERYLSHEKKRIKQACISSRSLKETDVEPFLNAFNARQYREAEQQALKLTQRYPGFSFCWKALGAVLQHLGRFSEALAAMQTSVQLGPEDAEAYNNLGNIQKELKKLSEAEASYRKAIALKSDYAEAYSNLATTLYGLRRLEEATACCHQALKLQPQLMQAHNNLGNCLKALGRLQEAEACYQQAIVLEPGYAEAYNNLANLLYTQGRHVEAEANCRTAIYLKPNYTNAHNNLGTVLKDVGRLAEAEACYRQALAISPQFAEAYNNLGNALKVVGRLDEALACYRQALAMRPEFTEARSNLLFTLNYSCEQPTGALLAEARAWEAFLPESVRAEARRRTFNRLPLVGRRLRVGYLSGDFRQHAVSYFIEHLFRSHDRNRVELFAYSTHTISDDNTRRIAALAGHWVPVCGLSDQALLERLLADQLDLLIDLSGHTAHNRLAVLALRAAPVQAHYLGYFGTTGLTEMDYWIGDPILTPPEHDSQFSEQVWRLPRTWVSYEGKSDAPLPNWQPAADGKIWLGSFNHLAKLTPGTLALWAKVLASLPEGRLLLKTRELAEPLNRQRILEAFAGHGIDPGRIELQDRSATTDWASHMSYYDRLDIALDPVGALGGGTTTCDALWMGVPVITLLGDRMGSRMTASMLAAIGHTEWIAQSEAEYIEKVITLARNLELRAELRTTQRQRMAVSPLCDAGGLAQTLEGAYKEMFNRWLTGIRKS